MPDAIHVAAAGDIHCAPPLRDHVMRVFAGAADADLILLAGDLTTRGEREQADVLAEACASVTAPVIAVLYFILIFSVSKCSSYLERRLQVDKR